MNRYFGLHTLEGEWHSLLPRYLLLAERVVGRRILDIGCGTGIGSSLLLELGAERVDAIDYRPAVLEIARMKHAKPGLDFHVMFWEELDFDDQTFDMVICLDPASPVTDRNLLLEMRRVLKPGGEYICAVERKNLRGIESVLPRYGYADVAENIALNTHHERVPQIGALSSFFETIVSVTQQPHLSYIFDVNSDVKGPHTPDAEPVDEMRRVSTSGDSGLWSGPALVNAAAQTDGTESGTTPEPSERWITMDRRFCSQRDEASVEILFCGDSYLSPAPVREVRLPYYPLVERLQGMSSALQSRSHAAFLENEQDGFGALSDDGVFAEDTANATTGGFSERASTSEYLNLNDWEDNQDTSVSYAQQRLPYLPSSLAPAVQTPEHSHAPDYSQDHANYTPQSPEALNEIQAQLAHVGNLYEQVRREMEDLIFDTRRELAERDRYIEQLVGTVHRWEQHFHDYQTFSNEMDRESTGIFTKSSLNQPASADNQAPSPANSLSDSYSESDDDDEPKTTTFFVSDADTKDDNSLSRNSSSAEEPSDEPERIVNSGNTDHAADANSTDKSDASHDDKEEHSV